MPFFWRIFIRIIISLFQNSNVRYSLFLFSLSCCEVCIISVGAIHEMMNLFRYTPFIYCLCNISAIRKLLFRFRRRSECFCMLCKTGLPHRSFSWYLVVTCKKSTDTIAVYICRGAKRLRRSYPSLAKLVESTRSDGPYRLPGAH